MNILHVNNFHYLRGGSEAVYFETANLLEEHGHNSVFFSVNHPETTTCKTSKFFIPYIDLNARHSLATQFKIAIKILYSSEARKCLSQLLDRYSVDIAHLHNIYHHISPSILYEFKKRKIPVVMTLHDYKMVCTSYALLLDGKPCEACCRRRFYMAIKNRCIKKSLIKSMLSTLEIYCHQKVLDIYDSVDIFISPSRFLREKLIQMGFKKEIVILSNFVDSKKFEKFTRSKEENHKYKSIVYFGRLSFEKGLWTLLEAARQLYCNDEYRDVEIKIIGDGLEKNELREKVLSEGINNVKFLGYIEGEALYSEISKSVSVVLPSEWYENNPVSVLESFTLGIPVIGANIGGIPELVKNNVTGLIFEQENASDLSEKIKYMINNPDKAVQMGQNGKKFMKTDLNAEKHYKRLLDIYRSASEKSIFLKKRN